MSTSDPETPRASFHQQVGGFQVPVEPVSEAEASAVSGEEVSSCSGSEAQDQADPTVEETTREVTLQRSVRHGRILMLFSLLGAVSAAVACTFYPIPETAAYSLANIVGFMMMIGAAFGLGVGGVVALVLGRLASRKRGTGVAIQTDVR